MKKSFECPKDLKRLGAHADKTYQKHGISISGIEDNDRQQAKISVARQLLMQSVSAKIRSSIIEAIWTSTIHVDEPASIFNCIKSNYAPTEAQAHPHRAQKNERNNFSERRQQRDQLCEPPANGADGDPLRRSRL